MSCSYFAYLPCAYLAQHEPESANTVLVIQHVAGSNLLPCQYLSCDCLSAESEAGRRSLCDTCGLHSVIAHQYRCAFNCHAPLLCICCCIKDCFAQACLSFAGVSIGESRQVIQVPGAPPVTIRFGTRPPVGHPPPLGQQVLAPHGMCSLDQIICVHCGSETQCHCAMCLFAAQIADSKPFTGAKLQILSHRKCPSNVNRLQTPNCQVFRRVLLLCASHLHYKDAPRGCCSQCHCILNATASMLWQLPICATQPCLH